MGVVDVVVEKVSVADTFPPGRSCTLAGLILQNGHDRLWPLTQAVGVESVTVPSVPLTLLNTMVALAWNPATTFC